MIIAHPSLVSNVTPASIMAGCEQKQPQSCLQAQSNQTSSLVECHCGTCPLALPQKQGCWSIVGRNSRVLVFRRVPHRELVPIGRPAPPMSPTQVSNGSFWFQGRSTAFVPPIFSLERFSLGVIVIVVLIDKYPVDSGFELKSSTFVDLC